MSSGHSAVSRSDVLECRTLLSSISVLNTNDSGPGSLRQAIDDANNNPGPDTVTFATSAWGTILLTDQLVITDDLTIEGPGADKLEISGGGVTRVFAVLPADLSSDYYVTPSLAQVQSSPAASISRLTIRDGFANDAPGFDPASPANPGFAFGGGLYNLGGSVHLDRVVATNNAVSGVVTAGGAVANEFGGKLTVSRSDFEGNSSNGVLIAVGGAITSDLGATAEAVSFSIEGSGTALEGLPLPGQDPRPHDIVGTFTIGGTTLTHTGMGMLRTDTADLATLTGTFGSAAPFVFTDTDGDSLVTHYGRTEFGAAGPGTFEMTVLGPADAGLGVLVEAHFIAEFVVQPGLSTGKYAGVIGSWIMDAYSEPFVLGTTAASDYRWESRAGAELLFPGQTGQPEVFIDRSSFEGNTAQAALGYIDGVAFSGVGGGGAILNVTGHMTIDRSHFSGNAAVGGNGHDGATSGGPAFGGAVLTGDVSPFGIAESSLTVSRSTFEANRAVGGQGTLVDLPGGQSGGGAISVGNGSDTNLSRNTFENNVAVGGGGGTNAAGGTASGGAISSSGAAEAALDQNKFQDNIAEGGDGSGSGAAAAGRGGALAIDSLELAGFFPGSATVSSSRDSFQSNVAVGGIGGGIYNEGDLTLSHASIRDNRALGLASVVMDFVPGYLFAGTALGGGVSNLGTLELTHSTFVGNEAIGADGANGPNVLTEPPGTVPVYPGTAVGGGLHNLNHASVRHSRFIGNTAEAGDNNLGTFSGVGNGGGIYNDGSLTVHGTDVLGNQASGGDNNVGDLNPGLGTGGGVASGSVAALTGVRSASLQISRSNIRDNVAAGGDGNSGLFPVPAAHQAGNGIGGGVLVYQGSVDIDRSLISGNNALGGDGGNAGGGGIFFLDFIGGVTATVSRSIIRRNTATAGEGGNALGGGLASGSLGSFFGGAGSVIVEASLISHNRVTAGAGAAALGGGIYNDTNSALKLRRSLVFHNRAVATDGGDGIGGGIYNLGTVELLHALVFANFASSDEDNCFGC